MNESLNTILAVVVGGVIATLVPWLRESINQRQIRQKDAQYLAVRVVVVLDKFVEECARAVADNGLSFGQRDQDGCLSPQVPVPKQVLLPDDVNWRSIDHDLAYDLLSIPVTLAHDI